MLRNDLGLLQKWPYFNYCSKSAVKLENLRTSDGTATFSEQSMIQVVKPFNMEFDYKDFEGITESLIVESKEVNIKELNEFNVF